MLLLVPLKQYCKLIDKEIEPTISMINIDFNFIETINRDVETGLTIINYKTGVTIKPIIKYEELLSKLYSSGIVNTSFLENCKKIDTDFNKEISKYIKNNDR